MTDEQLDKWIEANQSPTPWSKMHREMSKENQLKSFLELDRQGPFYLKSIWIRGAWQLVQENWR